MDGYPRPGAPVPDGGEALVISAQGGDREAFTSLAAGIIDRLYAVAFRILRDPALADDATQQALVEAWRKLSGLRDPKSFDAWTYRILVRACGHEARRARRWAPNLLHRDERDAAGPDELAGVIERDELDRAFTHLSVDHRAVVVLHHYLDLPLDRVAEVLGVPIGTVRSRLFYAMRKLRVVMATPSLSTSEAAR
jgi:RNA polymerase sigma-70 factor (ECF subfamily)